MKAYISSAALLLAACSNEAPVADETIVGAEGGIDRSQAGATMPSLEFEGPESEPATLAQLAGGEPVLVNLWASWCAPCVEELPTLVELSTLESAGIPQIVYLNQDIGSRASVAAFLEDKAIEIPIVLDPDGAMPDAANIAVMPTTILYDGDGREVWRYLGDRDWSDAESVELVGEAF